MRRFRPLASLSSYENVFKGSRPRDCGYFMRFFPAAGRIRRRGFLTWSALSPFRSLVLSSPRFAERGREKDTRLWSFNRDAHDSSPASGPSQEFVIH